VSAVAAAAAPKLARRRSGLPPLARPYHFLVLAAAAAIAIPSLRDLAGPGHPWLLFGVLAVAASAAQLFVVRNGRNQSYHTAITFLFVGVLTLPAPLLVLLVIVMHIPEWLKHRYAWYIQTFNIANYVIDAFVARATIVLVAGSLDAAPETQLAVAALAGCATFALANHALLAVMLRLARGLSFRKSGLFRHETLATDVILAALAPAIVVLWASSPVLVPFAFAPLLLVHRSFTIPVLREAARHDPKTGLYNARHFSGRLEDELERARSLGTELSLIVADLDLLRDINNTHGHLAGDAVICGIADVFRRNVRENDVAARFGGEEFAILLPATSKRAAVALAERLRAAVEAEEFEVPSLRKTVRATLSLGVASTGADGQEANGLVHAADAAVYRAKAHGRNRVRAAGEVRSALEAERRLEPHSGPGLAQATSVAAATVVQTKVAAPGGVPRPRFPRLSAGSIAWIASVGVAATAATGAAVLAGPPPDAVGVTALVLVAGVLQTLALEWAGATVLAPAIVAMIAGVTLFGPATALPIAVAQSAVEWSARRPPLRQLVFGGAALCLGGLAGGIVLAGIVRATSDLPLLSVPLGLAAGVGFFVVYASLVGGAVARESTASALEVWRALVRSLAPACLLFGGAASVVALTYESVGSVAFLAVAVAAAALPGVAKAYRRWFARVLRAQGPQPEEAPPAGAGGTVDATGPGAEAALCYGNRRIAEAAERCGFRGAVPFICECTDPRCLARVELTLTAFSTVRAEGLYVLAEEHAAPPAPASAA
jgi:diguanylate cyclase (GGDEF)-like protein